MSGIEEFNKKYKQLYLDIGSKESLIINRGGYIEVPIIGPYAQNINLSFDYAYTGLMSITSKHYKVKSPLTIISSVHYLTFGRSKETTLDIYIFDIKNILNSHKLNQKFIDFNFSKIKNQIIDCYTSLISRSLNNYKIVLHDKNDFYELKALLLLS